MPDHFLLVIAHQEHSMSQLTLPAGMEIKGEIKPGYEKILTLDV
jgi:hypothetical protein